MSKLLLLSLIIMTGCGGRPAPQVKTPAVEEPPSNVSTIPLSQIDLTRIGAIAPKGRVQDRDYNQLPVVESLIAHGSESVPYLISKLESETRIEGHVFDFWYNVYVGDVAFVILTSFFTDATWQKTSIPGVDYDTFLERKGNSNLTGEQVLRKYIAKYGRQTIASRWRNIWAQYKDRVYWNEHDRCFKLKDL